jgi:hypothetical protein
MWQAHSAGGGSPLIYFNPVIHGGHGGNSGPMSQTTMTLVEKPSPPVIKKVFVPLILVLIHFKGEIIKKAKFFPF